MKLFTYILAVFSVVLFILVTIDIGFPKSILFGLGAIASSVLYFSLNKYEK